MYVLNMKFIVLVILGVALIARAEDPPKLKTETDAIQYGKERVEFTMVQLPAGKVTIKDKDGKDKVVEIKPIWIGQKEVTWDEYDVYWEPRDVPHPQAQELIAAKLRPSRPYSPPDRGWGRQGWPAGSITLAEAQSYCKWLSQITGKKYRLPTEAEWQYACQAGKSGTIPPSELKKRAWYSTNSEDQTHPVGTKLPNPWGLHDMLGNVSEWVTRDDGSSSVAGGSYKDDAEKVHPGAREDYHPRWQEHDPQFPKGRSWLSDGAFAGIRVVREE